ncbi:MAG: hypothetical protein QOF59_962 [Actinomycetota bacterium]|nr:hypothetical protein [Actinomycetota bacterium]
MHLHRVARVAVVGLSAATWIPVASLGATATPATAASPAWSIVKSPSPAGSADGHLNGVTCTGTTNCFAVGQTQGAYTLAERWNGAKWSVVPTPEPQNFEGFNGELDGVGCTSATNCFAVGSNSTFIVIERWDGTRWALTKASAQGVLSGISCVGATTCHAVGAQGVDGFAMRWNGSFWATVTAAKPSGASSSALSGVKCTAVSNCVAVGSYVAGGITKTLVERWNGTSWSIVPSPNPAGATSSRFNSVACPLTTSCFAAGTRTVGSQTRTLIERWNGTAWSIIASPNPTGVPTLSSVGCSSASSCFAVGSVDSNTFIERWNGTAWTIIASPNPTGAQTNALHGVNCVSATECYAVGNADGRTMTQRWNGSAWSIQADPVGGSQSSLTGVACPSSTSCLAVGSYRPPGKNTSLALVERWNGTVWTIVATPTPAGSTAARLVDIDCLSATSCVAVGAATVNGQDQTLVERWNGTVWTIMTSPNVVAGSNVFADVDCTSATNCFAVGATIIKGQQQTLIERGNGTTWTIASGAVTGRLNGVSCASAADCMATGTGLGTTPSTALVEHWNGSSWTAVPGPSATQTDSVFIEAVAVSCTAANACTIVAHSENDFLVITAFAAHWNGSTWASASLPSPGVPFPSDVSCLSASDCTAVGNYFDFPLLRKTLVDHWDGSAWSTVPSPSPAFGRDNSLDGVTCTGATECTAVGSWISDAFQHTLVERSA